IQLPESYVEGYLSRAGGVVSSPRDPDERKTYVLRMATSTSRLGLVSPTCSARRSTPRSRLRQVGQRAGHSSLASVLDGRVHWF
ncbi:unnamed protein product, partial [Ectocarpus sp. 8 AP-2014]